MKRAGYRDAIQWLADNDDNSWVEPCQEYESMESPSVSACLVADLFGIDTNRVRDDLCRRLFAKETHAILSLEVSSGQRCRMCGHKITSAELCAKCASKQKPVDLEASGGWSAQDRQS